MLPGQRLRRHWKESGVLMRLIDADERIETIRAAYCKECNNYSGVKCRACRWDDAMGTIEDAPTVDAVEAVRGEWVHCNGKSNLWYCSVCGEKILYNPTRRTYNIEKRPVHAVNKFCRGCGAKMDGNWTAGDS